MLACGEQIAGRAPRTQLPDEGGELDGLRARPEDQRAVRHYDTEAFSRWSASRPFRVSAQMPRSGELRKPSFLRRLRAP